MPIKKLSDTVNAVFALAAVAVTVLGFVWYFIDDEVDTKVKRFVGVEAALEAIGATNQEIVKTNRTLGEIVQQFDKRLREANSRSERMETRLSELVPTNQIFQVDMLRSLVYEDCPTDGVCRYTFRVRRTALGKDCNPPAARRFVIDRFGVTHPVESALGQTKSAGDGWTDLTNEFILPKEVPEGVAEFYMELVYTECFDDDVGRKVRERTPSLIFNVNPR